MNNHDDPNHLNPKQFKRELDLNKVDKMYYNNCVRCVENPTHVIDVDEKLSREIYMALTERNLQCASPYMTKTVHSYLPIVENGEVKQPGDTDSKFREFKSRYVREIIKEFKLQNIDDELYRSMMRPCFLVTPLPNNFVGGATHSEFDKFLSDNVLKLSNAMREIGYKRLLGVSAEQIKASVNKATSPGMRLGLDGVAYPASDKTVSIYVQGVFEKEVKDNSDIKKHFAHAGIDNLSKVAWRDYNKVPFCDDDFNNMTTTLIFPGRRTNNFDSITPYYLTKDREVMFYKNHSMHKGMFNMRKYQTYVKNLFPNLGYDQLTPLRGRLVMAVNAAYASRFLPLCKALMYKVEHNSRHFLNTNADLINDFKKFVGKYKPQHGLSIDQSQCDSFMSNHVKVVMGFLPNLPIIQTAASNWLFHVGWNKFIRFASMPSGVPWTTCCNHYFSYIKWAMIFSLIELKRFDIDYVINKINEIVDFFECKTDSVTYRINGKQYHAYLFCCTDNMDASFQYIDQHVRDILEFGKFQFKLNYELKDGFVSFGHQVFINGLIQQARNNQAEKVPYFEDACSPGHAYYKTSSREETLPGICEILIKSIVDTYGGSAKQVKYELEYAEARWLESLRLCGVKISHMLKPYSPTVKFEHRYLVGKGIEDDIVDIDSMNAFISKDSIIDFRKSDDSLDFFKQNFK